MWLEFKREAEKFFHLRRRQRKLFQDNSTLWVMLGSGLYGEAWAHPEWPDLVLKISGPQGWGEGPHSRTYPGKLDAWPVFARHCQHHPHKHLPTVYHVEQFNQGMAWGVVEKCAYWAAPASDHPELEEETELEFWTTVRSVLEGTRTAPAGFEWMWPLVQMVDAMGFQVDLHAGNIMRCVKSGELVINDPFSST